MAINHHIPDRFADYQDRMQAGGQADSQSAEHELNCIIISAQDESGDREDMMRIPLFVYSGRETGSLRE